MSRLNGKVAVITGGSSGIGLATAQRFVDEGAYVFIMGRRQSELDKAEAVIGDGLTTVAGDVTSGADQGRARSGVGYGSRSHPKSTPTIGCRISTSITTD